MLQLWKKMNYNEHVSFLFSDLFLCTDERKSVAQRR